MLIRGTTLYYGSYFPVKKGYKKVKDLLSSHNPGHPISTIKKFIA